MEAVKEETAGAGSLKQITVIRIGGYMEFCTADELDKVLSVLLQKQSYNIIIDLAAVDYISSRGWSIFLSKIKEIRENDGDIKLTNMNGNVYEVYKVLEFFWFLRVYDSMPEAVRDFDLGVPPMPE
ncbi:MAG: STAS domain-containing protein [Calditrichaeota bacterium]|nr:STAS domain-containing protein [Calditrichota bacterium]